MRIDSIVVRNHLYSEPNSLFQLIAILPSPAANVDCGSLCDALGQSRNYWGTVEQLRLASIDNSPCVTSTEIGLAVACRQLQNGSSAHVCIGTAKSLLSSMAIL